MEITPFNAHAPEADLADLRRRLGETRWPSRIPGSGWEYGTDVDYLKELCRYWETEFDWRHVEDQVNAWPQFTTTIDGQNIHFLHVKAKVADATPLLLLHGWPGSVLEFLEVLGPLTDPVAHGGSEEDAFDVICPSLPGFGWSGPTAERGWDLYRMCGVFEQLMDGLGYDRFAVQGGDWGSMLAIRLAERQPDRVIGVHVNMLLAGPVPGEELTDEEKRIGALMQSYAKSETGYVSIQATKPQTLAVALTDSPAGLASWFIEKFRTWTDWEEDFESALTRDGMLADITLYWLTRTAGSAARIYYEAPRTGSSTPPTERGDVPMGHAVFPKEMYKLSRRWAERMYAIRRWTEMPRGGHFAAWEQPELFVDDVRGFFRGLRQSTDAR